MQRILIRLAAALPLASLFLLAACSRQVDVCVPVPLTGDQAQQGKDVLNGVQLAADEWNAKGGVLGREINVISADDEGDEDQAVKLARQWGNAKVSVVIGHYNSSSTLAAMEEYYAKRTLMITPTSTNADVTSKGYPTIFRVCGRDDQQAETAAKYVCKYFPGATVALVHDKSPYGQELANQFLRGYQSITAKESVYYGGVERSKVDFSSLAAKLKELQPGVIYFGGLFPQGAALLKDLRAAGVTATFVSGDGCFDPNFLKQGGPAVEGALVTFYPDMASRPSCKAVVDAYKAKFGTAPGPYSVFAYKAAVVAFQGMTKANSTDSLEVAKALHAGEFETPMGTLTFTEGGDPTISPYVFWKVEGGKFVPVDMNAPAPPSPPPPTETAPKP